MIICVIKKIIYEDQFHVLNVKIHRATATEATSDITNAVEVLTLLEQELFQQRK